MNVIRWPRGLGRSGSVWHPNMAAVSLFWDMHQYGRRDVMWKHSNIQLLTWISAWYIYSTTNIIVKSKNQKSAIFFTNPSSTLPWPEVPSAPQTRIICVTLLFSLCVFSFIYFCFCRKHQLQNLPAAASICHCPWPTLAFEWTIRGFRYVCYFHEQFPSLRIIRMKIDFVHRNLNIKNMFARFED